MSLLATLDGTGRDGALIHSGNSIQLFGSDGGKLELRSSAVTQIPGSWQFAADDKFVVGDFNT